MARDLRHLLGRQLAVDVLGERLAALGEPLISSEMSTAGSVRHVAQLLDALAPARRSAARIQNVVFIGARF